MKKSMSFLGRLFIGIPILFAVLIISNSCTEDSSMYGSGNNNGGSGSPGTNEVWIRGMDFDPAVITIVAGTTITWTNKDNAAHTVTSDDVLFDSGSIGENETYSFTFATPGSYPYHCALHSSMTAEVVVN